jgi:hypothetical protein
LNPATFGSASAMDLTITVDDLKGFYDGISDDTCDFVVPRVAQQTGTRGSIQGSSPANERTMKAQGARPRMSRLKFVSVYELSANDCLVSCSWLREGVLVRRVMGESWWPLYPPCALVRPNLCCGVETVRLRGLACFDAGAWVGMYFGLLTCYVFRV